MVQDSQKQLHRRKPRKTLALVRLLTFDLQRGALREEACFEGDPDHLWSQLLDCETVHGAHVLDPVDGVGIEADVVEEPLGIGNHKVQLA